MALWVFLFSVAADFAEKDGGADDGRGRQEEENGEKVAHGQARLQVVGA
jgi:hypothetical protein